MTGLEQCTICASGPGAGAGANAGQQAVSGYAGLNVQPPPRCEPDTSGMQVTVSGEAATATITSQSVRFVCRPAQRE